MRLSFATFGCRLNHAEALDMEARFAAAGHLVVPIDAEPPPDCIIVRGCSVTAKAQVECERFIARMRRCHPCSRIVPTGCLPFAEPIAILPPAPSIVPMTTSRAFLKVQDGCSGRCAFCIVPKFRGPPQSVPFNEVVDRARAFLAAGFREMVVTGCNLALYRDSGRGLAELLAALAELPPPPGQGRALHTADGTIHRIRLGSLEPGICDAAVLDAFATHPNICRSMHLSLQSGSDRILELMNRPYTAKAVMDFCIRARRRLGPRCSFGADVIAGFPGETDADHRATMRLLGRKRAGTPIFSNLHVFPYSDRPGTLAAQMPDAVPRNIRTARAKELEAIGVRNRMAFAQSFVGRKVVACIEKDGDGWTDEYLRVRMPSGLARRKLVCVKVLAAEDGILRATRAQGGRQHPGQRL